jgi:hypothetical protein
MHVKEGPDEPVITIVRKIEEIGVVTVDVTHPDGITTTKFKPSHVNMPTTLNVTLPYRLVHAAGFNCFLGSVTAVLQNPRLLITTMPSPVGQSMLAAIIR